MAAYAQQGGALIGSVAPPTEAGQGQGFSVSISGNGEWMVTCSQEADRGEDGTGSVIVFRRTGQTWAEHQVIPTVEATFGRFSSVAISGDGSTIVAGAAAAGGQVVDPDPGLPYSTEPGKAWVYTKDGGGVWSLDTEITAGARTAGAQYGNHVAVNYDGTRAVVGAWLDHRGEDPFNPDDFDFVRSQGTAYIWHLITGTWTLIDGVQGTGYTPGGGDPDGALWGSAVAISGDGNTIASYGSAQGGNTWIWVWNGSAWEEEATLPQNGGRGSLSYDGDVALMPDVSAASNTGQVDVWTRSGSWSNTSTITAAEAAADSFFGISTALSSDGTVAAVGAYGQDGFLGAFWAFSFDGATWDQLDGPYAADDWIPSPQVNFGEAISLSVDDGAYVAVGGPENNELAANIYEGASWVFVSAVEVAEIDLARVRFRIGG